LHHTEQGQVMCSMMEQERREVEEMTRLVQGNLLNKVYEIQCERERQFNLVSQMMEMTVSPLTNTPKVDMSCLNTAMSDLSVEQQDMEVPPNQAYTQYMLERSGMEEISGDPHSQGLKRSDPVYLTSMASHGVWHRDQQHILPLEQHHPQLQQQNLPQLQQHHQHQLQQHPHQQLQQQHYPQLQQNHHHHLQYRFTHN